MYYKSTLELIPVSERIFGFESSRGSKPTVRDSRIVIEDQTLGCPVRNSDFGGNLTAKKKGVRQVNQINSGQHSYAGLKIFVGLIYGFPFVLIRTKLLIVDMKSNRIGNYRR